MRPFAFQYYAKDFFAAYRSHRNTDKFSPARLFLICMSIELAAKAFHVAEGKSGDDLKKKLGHRLGRACNLSVLAKYGIALEIPELVELDRADDYYVERGFQYFIFGPTDAGGGPTLALRGWPDLPNEQILVTIFEKLCAHSF
jgi:hypothetical protein